MAPRLDASSKRSLPQSVQPPTFAPSFVPGPLLKEGANREASLSFISNESPSYAVPRVGERAIGILGDHNLNKPLLQRLNWLHVPLLLITPMLAIYGCAMWKYDARTLAFAVFYYFFSGLGITAGES